ncbi:hypothetical protein AOLI_G00099550 [Acnodon oligacanthus]
MNSLWRLVGVTLSRERAGFPSPKEVTDAMLVCWDDSVPVAAAMFTSLHLRLFPTDSCMPAGVQHTKSLLTLELAVNNLRAASLLPVSFSGPPLSPLLL